VTREPLSLGALVAAVLPIHFRAGHGIAPRAPQDRVGLLCQFEAVGRMRRAAYDFDVIFRFLHAALLHLAFVESRAWM